MNVLSLFDGMSGAHIALERSGIKLSNYYASEIDRYSIQVTMNNYPKTIQLGDINLWRSWDLDFSKIDLIIGGSPCQGFSVAGKKLGFEDPRSRLFFKFYEIVDHAKSLNPNLKFLLENVKMKKDKLDVISSMIGADPVLINSSLVSAQNRQRYYWCNWKVNQPEDKNIYLSDVINNGVTDRIKSYCIDANYHKGGNLKSYFQKGRRQLIFLKGIGNNLGGIQYLDGKCIPVTSSIFENNDFVAFDQGFRKLTPIEVERLQTVPEDYTKGVSNTQRYKMLGNGFTVDVIAHLLNEMIRSESAM